MDLSKVSRLEERQRWASIHKRREELEERSFAIRKPMFDEINAARRESIARQVREFKATEDAITARHESHPDLAAIKAERDEVTAEIDAVGLEVSWNEDGEYLVCALTGLPILQGDEVLVDNETGEMFLRAALPVPPREQEPLLPEDPVDEVPA